MLAPTGPYRTGTRQTVIEDGSRFDPLAPESSVPVHRRFIVQIWYPTFAQSGQPASYLCPKVGRTVEANFGAPAGSMAGRATHSLLDAPVAAGNFPVVGYNAGEQDHGSNGTSVAQQLASQGMIVVAPTSTNEAPSEFPGGQLVLGNTELLPNGEDEAALARIVELRARDNVFAVRSLRNGVFGIDIANAANLDRIAMFGHSSGGNVALEVMRLMPEVVAAINMDGYIVGPAATHDMERPVLLLGRGNPYWDSFILRQSNVQQLITTGLGHYAFTDPGSNALDWDLKRQAPADIWPTVFSDLPWSYLQRLRMHYVTAFIEAAFEGRATQVFDQPMSEFPEVSQR